MSIELKSTVLLLTGILLKNYFFPFFFNFWDQVNALLIFFFQSALILSMLTHFEKKYCAGVLNT